MAQIMIVEDSQGTNKAICEYMKSAGHTLIPAFDGAEALNIFRDRKIDLRQSRTKKEQPKCRERGIIKR